MKPIKLLLPLALLLWVVHNVSAAFYESFDEPWEGRWIVSEKEEYTGVWKHERSQGRLDYGLLASEGVRKYGIAVNLPETVDFKDGTVVFQYDLKLKTGLMCGGAYLKFLLPQKPAWTPSQFDSNSPYSIMFGPDKCGSTNRVHFIFRHKHPKTGEFLEHHLKDPPLASTDIISHVYTAVIYQNHTVKILIDGSEQKTADLLSDDFEPSLIPPKLVPDPDDKKPGDWDGRRKIQDPEAVKPDDWDEDAPLKIVDLEAVKPEGWLDDEPDDVDDPNAVKPEDWSDDEEWWPPKVPNPKCEDAPGCGTWTPPTKRNPAYKGKWRPPMIDNPNYKGVWKPREIPNPHYFELEHPHLEPVAAIGIDIWTMQHGILFDNILITHDEVEAAHYREKTWRGKYDMESEELKKQFGELATFSMGWFKDKIFDQLYKLAEIPLIYKYRRPLFWLLMKCEGHPNVTLGILGAMIYAILRFTYKTIFKRSKTITPASIKKAKKQDISSPDDPKKPKDGPNEAESTDVPKETKNEGEEKSHTRQRITRKEA